MDLQVFSQLNLDPLPTRIALELTTVCNYSCPMCRQDKNRPVAKWAKPDLMERLDPVVRRDEFEAVVMVGLGENLLHPKAIDFLRWIVDCGKGVTMITNGTHLTPEMVRLLVEKNACIRLSMDATTEKTYQFMRHPKKWPFLLKQMEMINQIKEEAKSPLPVLALSMALNKATAEDFRGLPEFCSRYKIKMVAVNWMLSYTPEMFDLSFWNNPEEANRLLEEVGSELSQRGILATLPKPFKAENGRCTSVAPTPEFWSTPEAPRHCADIWQPWICADGTIAACCISYINVGNIYENEFEDIWQGPEYAKITGSLARGRPLPACEHCTAMLPTESREAHFVAPGTAQQPEIVDKMLEKRLRLPPFKTVSQNFNSGTEHLQKREFEESASFFRKVLEDHPFRAEAENNLAVALLFDGHHDEGRRHMLQAKGLRPSDPIIEGNFRMLS